MKSVAKRAKLKPAAKQHAHAQLPAKETTYNKCSKSNRKNDRKYVEKELQRIKQKLVTDVNRNVSAKKD